MSKIPLPLQRVTSRPKRSSPRSWAPWISRKSRTRSKLMLSRISKNSHWKNKSKNNWMIRFWILLKKKLLSRKNGLNYINFKKKNGLFTKKCQWNKSSRISWILSKIMIEAPRSGETIQLLLKTSQYLWIWRPNRLILRVMIKMPRVDQFKSINSTLNLEKFKKPRDPKMVQKFRLLISRYQFLNWTKTRLKSTWRNTPTSLRPG